MTPSLPSLPTNLAVAIEVYVTNADGSNQKSVTKTAMRVAYFDLIWAGGSGGPALLLEDDRALAVYEYPVLQVPTDGTGENAPLDLASEADQILHGVAVGDMGYILT
jgi:hypothetical protein